MNDQLDALLALWRAGTMAAAANRLRVTPSAVSKRIALLEEQVGYKLIEPKGRKVELTPAALRLVEKLDPLLVELRSVLSDEKGAEGGELTIGVTESVLSSWGPQLLADVARQVPHLKLDIHAHRSPVIVEHVRSGEFAGGLCAGVEARLPGLRTKVLVNEPMVLVPQGLGKLTLKRDQIVEVITIESHALSWDLLRPQLRRLHDETGIQVKVVREVESFSGVVQLARAGFGHGLAPYGIAHALGVSAAKMVRFPAPSLLRTVSFIARASTLARPSLQAFLDSLDKAASRLQPAMAGK